MNELIRSCIGLDWSAYNTCFVIRYLELEEQLAAQAAAKAPNPTRPSFSHKSGFTGKGEDERAVCVLCCYCVLL